MIGYRRNPLQEGRFGWCGRGGMSLSEGTFWGRLLGGYNFYLGRDGLSQIDFDHPISCVGPSVDEISVGNVFSADSDQWIAVRSVGKFGLESEDYSWIRLRSDSSLNGSEVPDQVINLTSGTVYGTGKVQLIWEYEPRAGIVRPSVFRIYVLDGEPGNFSLWNEDDVPFREGCRKYIWDSSYLGSSYPYRMLVRAETSGGIDDGNMRYVIARGNRYAPGDMDGFDVAQV